MLKIQCCGGFHSRKFHQSFKPTKPAWQDEIQLQRFGAGDCDRLFVQLTLTQTHRPSPARRIVRKQAIATSPLAQRAIFSNPLDQQQHTHTHTQKKKPGRFSCKGRRHFVTALCIALAVLCSRLSRSVLCGAALLTPGSSLIDVQALFTCRLTAYLYSGPTLGCAVPS